MPEHDCFRLLNAELAKSNTCLVRNLLNPNQVVVETARIKNLRDGRKPTVVIASHCPFCGERLGDDHAA